MVEEPLRGWPTRNVPVMGLTTGLNVGSVLLWAPVLSLIMRDLGASDFEISLAAALWAAGSALVQYQGGRIADRAGRFPVMVYSSYANGLSLLLCALMPSWIPFAVLYAVYQAGNAMQSPTFSAFVGESVPPERRGSAYGFVEFSVGIGLILGPLIASRLIPVIGTKALMGVSGVLILVAAVIRHMFLKETKPATSGTTPFRFAAVFKGRLRLVLLIWITFNVMLSLTMWGPFTSLHASDAQGLSKAQIALFFALGSVVSAGSSLLAGQAVNRWGAYRTLAASMGGTALAFIFWSAQRNLIWLGVGYALAGSTFQMAMVASDAFRVAAVEDEIRGSAWGAIGTFASLTSALVIPIAGAARTALHWSAAPFWMGAVAAVVAVWGVYRLTLEDRRSGVV